MCQPLTGESRRDVTHRSQNEAQSGIRYLAGLIKTGQRRGVYLHYSPTFIHPKQPEYLSISYISCKIAGRVINELTGSLVNPKHQRLSLRGRDQRLVFAEVSPSRQLVASCHSKNPALNYA